MKKVILVLAICVASVTQLSAKRVLAYFPYYRSNADIDNIDFTKITDIVYGFVNPTIATGVLDQPEYKPALFDYLADKAEAKGVKVHFSVGGGGLSWIISQTLDNPTSRAALISNITKFVSGTNSGNHILAGVDIDWEFPVGTTEKNKHENFLKDLRAALTTKGTADSRYYELSIAVGGDVVSATKHTSYINPGAAQYCDFISLMAYDGPTSYGSNHSPYQMAVDCINAYAAAPLNFPKAKFMLAVPFYGRDVSHSSAELYKTIAAANPAAAFATDSYSSWYYNGNQTLRNKVDLICNQGGMGITIWEITQDRNSGQTYTLLASVADQMSKSSCTTVSVKENIISGFNIYPNPTNDILTVSGQNLKTIQVYDLMGKEVISISSLQENNLIDLQSLTNGMYLVKVNDSNFNFTSTLVVKQ